MQKGGDGGDTFYLYHIARFLTLGSRGPSKYSRLYRVLQYLSSVFPVTTRKVGANVRALGHVLHQFPFEIDGDNTRYSQAGEGCLR